MKKIISDIFILIFIQCLIIIASGCHEVSVTPDENLKVRNYKLYINSNPAGAKIFINNRYSGFDTPDTIGFLDPLNYSFSLRLKYFKDYNFFAIPDQDSVKDFNLNFYSLPDVKGKLRFNLTPSNTRVSYNDTLLSEFSPDSLSLNPGVYKLKFSADNHRSMEKEVEVYSSETTRLNYTLVDTSDIVIFNKQNSLLLNENVRMVKIDKHNVLWFFTLDFKIGKLVNGRVEYLDLTSNNIPTAFVFDILVDEDNVKWFATSLGVLKISDKMEFFDSNNSSLPPGVIYSLALDQNKDVWFAGQSGFGHIKNDIVTSYDNTTLSMENKSSYYSIAVSSNNDIVLGTRDQLVIWKDQSSVKVYEPIEEEERTIDGQVLHLILNDVMVDANDKIWFKTEGLQSYIRASLYSFDGTNMELKNQSIREFSNLELLEDNLFAVGNAYLLNFYKNENPKNILLSGYFNSDFFLDVFAISYSKDKNILWLGTNRGIVKIKQSKIAEWTNY